MQLPTRLLIIILLAMTASPVMAQRLIQASESGQESVDTSTFLNGTATLVGVSGIGSFTLEGSDVVIAGFRRALEVLLAPSPKPINQTYGDEEMFIG